MGKSGACRCRRPALCCGDGEERAEVYGCAADRQQATIVFDVAADMVRMCPALNRRVKILASQKRIIYEPTNSFYQVLSAEAYSKARLCFLPTYYGSATDGRCSSYTQVSNDNNSI